MLSKPDWFRFQATPCQSIQVFVLSICLFSTAGNVMAVGLPAARRTLPTEPLSLPVPLAQVGDARQTQADKLLEQGIQQFRTSQFAAALQSLQQALVLYRELKDQPKQVKTLRNLGNVYYLQANYEQARDYYQQSLDLARKIQDRDGEASALGNLGVAAIGMADYRQAEVYYQQALGLYRQLSDRLGEGQTLGNLGELAMNRGDYPKTLDLLQQALTIARSLKDQQLEANTVGSLGLVYYSLNDYPKAKQYHEQQLALGRQLGDRLGEAAALNNLGNTYFALGDYGQAITVLDQRLTLSRSIGDRLGEAQSLKNLSTIYYDLGNYTKAIELAFDSLAIAQAIKNRTAEASVLTNLGNLYLVVLDFPKAIDYHQRRLALARSMGNPSGAATALNNLGNVYKTMGRYAESVEAYEQALAIARQIQDQGQQSSALVNLGITYSDLGQEAKAIESHRQALAIARATQDRSTEGLILNNLGNSLFRSGNLAEAETTLRSGLQIWESLRSSLRGNDISNDINRVSIFDQQARTYRLLQRVLVANNKPDAALDVAERGRARAFVELLSRRLATTRKTSPTQAIAPPPTVEDMKRIANTQNSTLVTYSITYEDRLVNGKVEPKETELFIWAIAPNGTITFRKVDLKPLWQQQTSLRELVQTNREGIGVRGRGGAVSTRSETVANAPNLGNRRTLLYQLLIAPIAEALPKDPNARVTFIPQGELFLVPFAALRTPAGKYLIQDHTILTAPAIQVLALTHQQRLRLKTPAIANAPALVIGNPTMPTLPAQPNQPAEPLDALPGAEAEAKAIASLLGTQAITGDRATKQAIVQQMPQKRLIHLATHGLLDDIKGLGIPGAIALAPSGKDSGLLTADEILDLKLQAELVVLSACDTGRGRITGDGVIGLSRSFITAGVPSLIVSLWAVPDAPTAFLMTTFYENLKRNPDRARALRQAMLATLEQYPDPRDWGAFVLVGEAN